MGTKKAASANERETVDEIRRQVAALTEATSERHRLERGTAAYAAALETEERLADGVWRLGATLGPYHGRSPDGDEPDKSGA